MAGDEKLLPAKIDEDKLITIITITVNVVRNGGRGIIVVFLGLLNFFVYAVAANIAINCRIPIFIGIFLREKCKISYLCMVLREIKTIFCLNSR